MKPFSKHALKERLVQWFNRFDPSIIPKLKSGRTSFKLKVQPGEYLQLTYMLEEPEAKTFCESLANAGMAIEPTGMPVDATIALKPAVAQ
jgi:hypothetical protein